MQASESTSNATRQEEAHEIFRGLVARAGFAEPPELAIRPDGSLPDGAWAVAISDLQFVQITDALLRQDDPTLTCVLAHELGHLWHRHGRGGLWRSLGAVALSAVLFPLAWYLSGDFSFALVCGVTPLLLRVFKVQAANELRRERYDEDLLENQAQEFARQLVGEKLWAEYSRAQALRRDTFHNRASS